VGLQTCLQMLPRFWKPIAPQSAWSCPNSRELWLGRDFLLASAWWLWEIAITSWQQQPQQQQEQQRCYQSGFWSFALLWLPYFMVDDWAIGFFPTPL
jgi:hypothetical protein